MKTFSKKHPLLFSIIVISVVSVLMTTLSVIISNTFTGHNSATLEIIQLVAELVMCLVVCLVAIIIARHIGIAKGWFNVKGIAKGLLLGWYAILYAVAIYIINAANIPAEYWVAPKLLPLLSAFAMAFAIGLMEEVLVRGLVLNVLLNNSNGTRKDVLKACWISSVMFGVMHLTNFFAGAAFIETVGQVIYAAFIGMFLAAVYIRTKSLWVPIILHAIIDLQGLIMGALLSPQALENSLPQQATTIMEEIISSLGAVVISLPFVVVALILLRKKKIKDVVDPNTMATDN